MRNALRTVLIATGAVLLAGVGAGAAQAVDLITNGSFESPNINGQTFPSPGGANYEYPGGLLDSWTYGGSALVNATGSNAWYGSTPPSGFDGTQFAALQGAGTLSQTFNVTAAEAAGALTLSWVAAGRPNFGCCNGDQTYEVLIDGHNAGDFSTTSGTNFTPDSLDLAGLLTTGSNTLSFVGLATTDETAFIDNVALSAVPEPAAWAMMLTGFFGLGALLRTRRAQPLLIA